MGAIELEKNLVVPSVHIQDWRRFDHTAGPSSLGETLINDKLSHFTYRWVSRWQRLFPWILLAPAFICLGVVVGHPSLKTAFAWGGIVLLHPLFRRAINSTSIEVLGPGKLRVWEGPIWPTHASIEVQQVQGIKVRGHDAFRRLDLSGKSTHMGGTKTQPTDFPENYSVLATTPTQEVELLYFLQKGAALELAQRIADELNAEFDESQIEKVAPRDMPFITEERAKREQLGCNLIGGLIILGLIASAVVLILTHEP